MKRNFLLLCVFFLCSCASADFKANSPCPFDQGRHVSVLFEYGSAELNEKAVKQLQDVAREVRRDNSFVCFLGRLSYHGTPSGQALGAIDRIKNTSAVFIKEGVDPTKLYIGMNAEDPQIGLSQPQTAADEKHVLDLLIAR